MPTILLSPLTIHAPTWTGILLSLLKCAYLSCWVLTPHGGKEGHCKEVLGPLQVFFPGLLREQMKTFRQIEGVACFTVPSGERENFSISWEISPTSPVAPFCSVIWKWRSWVGSPLCRGEYISSPLCKFTWHPAPGGNRMPDFLQAKVDCNASKILYSQRYYFHYKVGWSFGHHFLRVIVNSRNKRTVLRNYKNGLLIKLGWGSAEA